MPSGSSDDRRVCEARGPKAKRPIHSEWVALGVKSRYWGLLVSDAPIRRAAFDWLAEQVPLHDDVLPWTLLQRGFGFDDNRIPLVSMPGIFKPRACELPLSIRTAVDGPYDEPARAAADASSMLIAEPTPIIRITRGSAS